MQENVRLRDFIPSGNCVSLDGQEEGPETNSLHVFDAIDRGTASDGLLVAAKAACLSCMQIEYCQNQREEMGDVLWKQGVTSAVVGGVELSSGGKPDYFDDLAYPSLRFDLSKVPLEPTRHLSALRQGVRARQLLIESRPPVGVKLIAGRYREMLAERDSELLASVDDGLDPKERDKAFRYISLVMSQQVDFVRFQTGRRSGSPGALNPRYNPETHDYELHYQVVSLYLNEVLRIKELGYKRPSQMAMYHNVEYGRALRDRFEKDFHPTSSFYTLVGSNTARPYQAIVASLARAQIHRMDTGDEPISAALRRAATNRQPAVGPDEREMKAELSEAYSQLGAKTVEQVVLHHTDPGLKLDSMQESMTAAYAIYGDNHPIVNASVIKKYAAKPDFLDNLEKLVKCVESLEAEFAGDSDVTPGRIRKFAHWNLAESRQMIVTYMQRLERWRQWAAENRQYEVPDSFLRERAEQGDAESFEAIAKDHRIKLLKLRFRARDNRRPAADRVAMDAWIYKRLASIYDVEEMDEAGENIHGLLSDGILMTAVMELDDLKDPLLQIDASAVADRQSRKYLTYSALAGRLTSQERLMIAWGSNLAPMLYGFHITLEQAHAYLGMGESDFNRNQIDSLRAVLQQDYADKSGQAISLRILQEDIEVLSRLPVEEEYAPSMLDTAGLTTVAGAEIVRLAQSVPDEPLIAYLRLDHAEWLMGKLNVSLPPSLRSVSNSWGMVSALRDGRLKIRDDPRAEFRLELGDEFQCDDISDAERSLVAHVIGADRLLYGRDLGHTLRHRFRTSDLASYMVKNILPQTNTWNEVSRALYDARITRAAFNLLLKPADRYKLWHIDDGLVAIRMKTITDLQESPLRSNAHWISHESLRKYAQKRNMNLASILAEVGTLGDGRMVCRDADTGVRDAFYSPRLSSRIRGLIDDRCL